MKIKYQIIGNVHFENFVASVNKALADGWTLQGGVAVTAETEQCYTYYGQAMVKHEEEPEPKPQPAPQPIVKEHKNYFHTGDPTRRPMTCMEALAYDEGLRQGRIQTAPQQAPQPKRTFLDQLAYDESFKGFNRPTPYGHSHSTQPKQAYKPII